MTKSRFSSNALRQQVSPWVLLILLACQRGVEINVVLDLSGSMAGAQDDPSVSLARHLEAFPHNSTYRFWRAGDSSPFSTAKGLAQIDPLLTSPLNKGGSTGFLTTLEAIWSVPPTIPRLTLLLTDGAEGTTSFINSVALGDLTPLWLEIGGRDELLFIEIFPIQGRMGGKWDLTTLYESLENEALRTFLAKEGRFPALRTLCLGKEIEGGLFEENTLAFPFSPHWETGEGEIPPLSVAPMGWDGSAIIDLPQAAILLSPTEETEPGLAADVSLHFKLKNREPTLLLGNPVPLTFEWNPPPLTCQIKAGERSTVFWEKGHLKQNTRTLMVHCDWEGQGARAALTTTLPPGMVIRFSTLEDSLSNENSILYLPPQYQGEIRLEMDGWHRWKDSVVFEIGGVGRVHYVTPTQTQTSPVEVIWDVDFSPPFPWWVLGFVPLGLLGYLILSRARFPSSLSLETPHSRFRPSRVGTHTFPWSPQSVEIEKKKGVLVGKLWAGKRPRIVLVEEAVVNGRSRRKGSSFTLRDGDRVSWGEYVITYQDSRSRGRRRRV